MTYRTEVISRSVIIILKLSHHIELYRLIKQQLKNLFFFEGLWQFFMLEDFKLSSCLVCKQ